MDLKASNVVWVHLDQDRDWWWAVVDYRVWSIWLCFSRGPKRCKSRGAKSRMYIVQWMFETLPSKLPPQGCHLLGFVVSWHQATLFVAQKKHLGSHRWRSDTESARSRFTMVLFTKHRVLCWRHAFSDNTLWRMRELPGWLCGIVGHWSRSSREMLFWTTICRIAKYSLFIL